MKQKRLTDLEWTMCWMAVRYAAQRRTGVCMGLPADLIRAYYHRFTPWQKQMLVDDLRKMVRPNAVQPRETINDKPEWLKFLAALEPDKHYEVTDTANERYTVFEVNGRVYPLHRYLEEPGKEIFLPVENIVT